MYQYINMCSQTLYWYWFVLFPHCSSHHICAAVSLRLCLGGWPVLGHILTVCLGYHEYNTLKYVVTIAFYMSVLHLIQHCALDSPLLHNLRMSLTKSLLLLMAVIVYILSKMHFMCYVHAFILKCVRVVWFVVLNFPQNIPI
jgi:hypothetical protein